MKKHRNLKICLGHFGGSLEWLRYMDNAWFPKERINLSDTTDIQNIIHAKNGMCKDQAKETGTNKGKRDKDLKAMNCFSIISELLKLRDDKSEELFPNLFADISYNLSDQRNFRLLKVRLDTDDQIKEKILFGTDFYMVAMKMTEHRVTINLRSFIGEGNFTQIAVVNPVKFLT